MSALSVTQRYFDLSNNRDLDNILKLFTEDAAYDSDNTALYFGASDIWKLGWSIPSLFWKIITIEEVTPNIVELSFTLHATDRPGKQVSNQGIERVVVNEKLRHIEVRNVYNAPPFKPLRWRWDVALSEIIKSLPARIIEKRMQTKKHLPLILLLGSILVGSVAAPGYQGSRTANLAGKMFTLTKPTQKNIRWFPETGLAVHDD